MADVDDPGKRWCEELVIFRRNGDLWPNIASIASLKLLDFWMRTHSLANLNSPLLWIKTKEDFQFVGDKRVENHGTRSSTSPMGCFPAMGSSHVCNPGWQVSMGGYPINGPLTSNKPWLLTSNIQFIRVYPMYIYIYIPANQRPRKTWSFQWTSFTC